MLVVLAAPVGIAFLVPLAATGSAWAGVAALVGHVWHDIPKSELRRMSDLLEAGQAALVAVAVDRAADDVRAALTGATTAVVTDGVTADLEADVALAIDEANANPSHDGAHLGSLDRASRRVHPPAAVTPAGAGPGCPWPRPGPATRPPTR